MSVAGHPVLRSEVSRELHARGPGLGHAGRVAVFAVLYAAAAAGAWWVRRELSAGWLGFAACVPLYLLAAASLHGISLFTHEAVHGTLSANAFWNRWLGAACAWPVLQNFAAYKVLHLRHHNHLGDEGDPDHYANYTRWTWLQFAMHWGRLLVGYPAYIIAIPILGFRHGTFRDRVCILIELAAVVAMVWAAWMATAWWGVPRALLLDGWLLPMLIINTLVNIRGMSQHTLLEHHSDDVLGTRSILTNRVTAFFMCNENYHLEHHLYPGVPWYNLPKVHAELGGELRERGAPYIRSYWQFVWEFVVGSVKRSPIGGMLSKPTASDPSGARHG